MSVSHPTLDAPFLQLKEPGPRVILRQSVAGQDPESLELEHVPEGTSGQLLGVQRSPSGYFLRVIFHLPEQRIVALCKTDDLA